MTKIRSINSNQLYIAQNAEVSLKLAGNTAQVTYDKVSNRKTKKTAVTGDIKRIASYISAAENLKTGTTYYSYNNLNQIVSETNGPDKVLYTYDDNGNLIKQKGTEEKDYIYDAENRLISATVKRGVSGTTEEYGYDHAGNRISKTVNGEDVTRYVNDISSDLTYVLAETDEEGRLKRSYTRGQELISCDEYETHEQLLSSDEDLFPSSDETTLTEKEVHYYIYDGHESTRYLTDEDGNIIDRYTYDAYGNLFEKEGETENEFLYTGEQYNYITELYYLRARYMDPSTGTFISMDSYAGTLSDPITLHKYLYANADPVMNTDPSGYMTMTEAVGSIAISTILTVSMMSAFAHILHAKEEKIPIIGDMYAISKELKDMLETIKASQYFGILIEIIPTALRIRNYIEVVYKKTVDIWIEIFPASKEQRPVILSIEGGSGTPKTSRRQAFRQAKEAAGIPKSAQYKTHKFVYDGTSENRIVYEFEVNGERKYIIEHTFDKMGRGNHFHGADASKGSPFDKGRYNQYDGHFPEDFDGFY